jgi:hypothetical protein
MPGYRKRANKAVVRMTDDEYKEFLRKVELSGKTQNSFLLAAITGTNIVSTDGLKAIIPDLKRIGVNVNQIAKNTNQGYPVELQEIKKIESELGEVWQLLRRLARGQVSDEPSST